MPTPFLFLVKLSARKLVINSALNCVYAVTTSVAAVSRRRW